MKPISQQESDNPVAEPTPSMKAHRTGCSRLLQDGANLVVIVGIVLALWQIRQTQQIESIRLAVEATTPIQSREFLEAYRNLRTAYRNDPSMIHTESVDDDLMLVVNVYESIVVLYLNDLLKDEIVELRLFEGMKKIAPILDAKGWPPSSRQNFNKTLERMNERMR